LKISNVLGLLIIFLGRELTKSPKIIRGDNIVPTPKENPKRAPCHKSLEIKLIYTRIPRRGVQGKKPITIPRIIELLISFPTVYFLKI
jgi:hypothetical protein